jgi:hypothetical protein
MATEGGSGGGGLGALGGMLVRRLRRTDGMGIQNWESVPKYLKILKTAKLHITEQMNCKCRSKTTEPND